MDKNQDVLSKLKPGDYVAFEWAHGIFGKTIIVDKITSVKNDEVLVHFMYGHSSEAEYIKKKDIIAIGDMSATEKIKGYGGKFNILQPDHELLIEKKEE